jgi:ActR/RegA family two-component response regulator
MAASSNPKLSAERVADPGAFERACEAALKKAKGNVLQASRELNVSRRTLTRYIERSAHLRRVLREVRKKEAA